ncbi:MerR family transcriptional regulator [Streptomyces sp. JW3]|uniref:MerR family transcriptional regulator n=1 Tax=Streptomyces sp. JW3 TaxID=3456955 RepID=UPI003FA42AED
MTPRPYAAGATLVTGALAAQETGVAPATIRKWVQLGHLSPADRQGRTHLYRLEDVFSAERTTRRRPPGARAD